jgi:enoyl-CoA hydratase
VRFPQDYERQYRAPGDRVNHGCLSTVFGMPWPLLIPADKGKTMSDPYARYTRLRFDRPHPKVLRIAMDNGRMNTADDAMHGELADIWRDADQDPTVNAVVITGAGKVFSAGGDFGMIQANIDTFEARTRQWKEARNIVYNVINCSKPVVSAMRGVAVGAGLVCGILADVSIATKDCRIIDGHTRLGVAAGDHAAIIWPLLCGMAKAKYYLLLCEQVLGAEAERIGLISLAVEDSELDAKAVEIATRLAEGAQSAIRFTKYALNNWLRQAGPTFDASLALEFLGFTGPEVKEGLASHQEKRKPVFPPGSAV